jgi:hypothetical protein
MSNLINEELETMKYLFGYQKGKVISEQGGTAAPVAATTTPAAAPSAATVPDVIKKIQEILNTKYGTKLTVDGKWGPMTQSAFENATKGTTASPANTTTAVVTVKVDPQTAKTKGFMVVKDDNKVLMPDQVKNGLIGGVDERDYDYVLLSTDGSVFACKTMNVGGVGASCYSSNKKTGNVVNKTDNIQSAKTNVGL